MAADLLWPLCARLPLLRRLFLGEAVGGCGHTFVWDAGTESSGWRSLSLSLSRSFSRHCSDLSTLLSLRPALQFCSHVHRTCKCVSLACICMYSTSICVSLFAAREEKEEEEQEQAAVSDAAASESYPWCRIHGNKAWKASDLIGSSGAAIQNSNP